MADELSFDREGLARSSSISARDLVAVFFRQRRLATTTFLLVLAAGILYGFVATTYQAEMKILVRRGRLDPPVTPQATAISDFSRNQVTEEELNSEAEFLRDSEIVREVVLATGLDQVGRRFWLPNESKDSQIERAIRHLSKKLTIEPVRKTTMIAVKYDSGDPKLAAQVLQELAAAYTRKHRQVQRPDGEFSFFEQQAAQYWDGLNSAQDDLLHLTRTRGVVSADLERDMLLRKLSDADASFRQVQIEIAANEQRIQSLRKQLSSLPEHTTKEIRTSDNAQLLEHLKTTLLTLELKHTELLTKYAPSYRLVHEVETQIAQTRAAIAAEQLSPVRDETTAKDSNFEWTTAELEKVAVEQESLRARSAASAVVLASYRSGVQQLAEDSVKQGNLLRAVRANEDKYLLYTRKQEEARIGDALDARGILNIAVVQQPRTPVLPKRSFAFCVLAAFLLAVVLSIGLAFGVDYLDPSFRTPDEVKAYLAAPVLASLPRRRA